MNINDIALNLVEKKIKDLRNLVPIKEFNKSALAEVEINKFYFKGEIVDRIMVVLRANGCEHYKKNGGCSMCSHFNGTMPNSVITFQNYQEQWDSVITGKCLETPIKNFSINNYPIVCVYNLGSLLNTNEISIDAIKYIFSSLNNFKGVKKVIIESRAEYVNEDILKVIKNTYDGIVEVGIGVESTNTQIRQLCHHKGLEDIKVYTNAVEKLHKFGFKALAYVNFKPVFLTEKEATLDAIKTSCDCLNMGFDAVSIEPTSLQDYSLENYIYNIGLYRVPWLWSLREVVIGIYKKINKKADIRLGGYFDEEILSGSQGVGFERNEIFPHLTSCNCNKCTGDFVQSIKDFNKTYNLECLTAIMPCNNCYEVWKQTFNINDKRTIQQRIIDALGGDE